jgi:hypothetical protein
MVSELLAPQPILAHGPTARTTKIAQNLTSCPELMVYLLALVLTYPLHEA